MSRVLLMIAAIGVALVLPLYISSFWLQLGLFAMSAAMGAIGLTILIGIAGQLSLAHAFFVAIGAYGYVYLAGETDAPSAGSAAGLGLPPLVALVGAVLAAGAAGALFSPIAARLRGIYLGIASIGLVFVGQHILFNAPAVTGGFNGRDVPPFELPGLSFTTTDPEIVVFGVPYGPLERLWYLGLLLLAIACWYARNLTAGRPGRALEAIRDSEVAASVMGVNVHAYRAGAFTVSSMYAGLAGVMLALAYGRIVPETFGFLLSIDYLVMVVVGGLGSVGGAVVGAIFVSALPQILTRYSDALPLLAPPGAGGLGAADAARLLYGAAITAVLLFAPGGLAELWRRQRTLRRASYDSTAVAS